MLRTWRGGVLWCCLTGLTLAGCSGRPEIANRDAPGASIICFGDSLTCGYGAAPGRDYPALLAQLLGREVLNAGVNGDTTQAALARLDRDVLARHPRLVIVILGGNDFLHGVPLARTFANLDAIVRRIQEGGAMVALASVPSGLVGDPAQEEYARLARARRAAFMPDLMDGILDNARFKHDTIHPNEAGYRLMAQRIAVVVRPLVE